MTGLKGNSEFCFPENIEVEGKQNSLSPEGPVIKCFVIPPELEKAPKIMICLMPLRTLAALRISNRQNDKKKPEGIARNRPAYGFAV